MTQKTKMKKDRNTPAQRLAAGISVSMMVMVASIALVSALIASEFMNEDGLGYYIVFVHLLSTIAGCCIVTRKCKENIVYFSLLVGVLYTLVLLMISALFFGGQYHGVSVTVLVVITGCVIAAMTSKCGRKGVKTRRCGKRRC